MPASCGAADGMGMPQRKLGPLACVAVALCVVGVMNVGNSHRRCDGEGAGNKPEPSKAWQEDMDHVRAELATAKQRITELVKREKEADARAAAAAMTEKQGSFILKAAEEHQRLSSSDGATASGNLVAKNASSECPAWPPRQAAKRSIRVVVVGDVSFARDIKKVCCRLHFWCWHHATCQGQEHSIAKSRQLKS